MEYRLPVKVSKLRSIVDALARSNHVFDRDEAIIDLMLALDRGKLKPYRYYAKRWRWKESTTYKRWKGLLQECNEWRDFSGEQKVSAKEAQSKQSVSKKRPKQRTIKAEVSAKEAQSKQVVSSIEHTTYLHTTNGISDTNVSSVVSDEPTMTNQEIMDSWNEFAKSIGSPTIRELTPIRKEWIRLRRKKIVPRLDEIYAAIRREPFLCGKVATNNGRVYNITFEYLWRNANNYIKILEGGHWSNGAKTPPARNGYQQPETRPQPAYKPYQPPKFDPSKVYEE